MKRVLITGAGSYLGTQAAAFLEAQPDRFATHTVDVQGDAWQRQNFAGFDAVLHVAGIAHQRETKDSGPLYDAVNRDLAVAVAEKAKAAGVKQFVLLSTMSVYGLICGRITRQTQPKPNTQYGKSKWQAEQAIGALACETFQVAILRPPMIYGKGCKGNYPRLSSLVQALPMLPRVQNERSMLYVQHLNQMLAGLLESGQGGLFFPQNNDYVCTDELARQIALAHGKKLWQPRGLGCLLGLLTNHIGVFGKLFGTLTYDQAMSTAFGGEPQLSFEDTIRQTEAQP